MFSFRNWSHACKRLCCQWCKYYFDRCQLAGFIKRQVRDRKPLTFFKNLHVGLLLFTSNFFTNINGSIHGDLSSEDGIKEVVEKVKATQSSLDALIHCAAIRYMNEVTYVPGDALDKLEAATLSAPYQGWEHTFRLNVLAPYFLTAGLIKLLGEAAAKGEGRGCVILFSSPASVHNHQFVPCYQTSKAAVDHLVRIMAAEFADYYSKT